MRWTTWMTVAAVLLAAPSARADGPVLPPDIEIIHPVPRVDVVGTLEYALKPGTEGVCMGAQEFRWELATLAGRDYYDRKLKGVLVGHWRVVVGRSRQGFVVTSEFVQVGSTFVRRDKDESQGTDRLACYRALQTAAVRMHVDFGMWERELAEEAARTSKLAVAPLAVAPSCRSPKPQSTADAVPLPCPESLSIAAERSTTTMRTKRRARRGVEGEDIGREHSRWRGARLRGRHGAAGTSHGGASRGRAQVIAGQRPQLPGKCELPGKAGRRRSGAAPFRKDLVLFLNLGVISQTSRSTSSISAPFRKKPVALPNPRRPSP